MAVADVLGWLSAEMSYDEVITDFPKLTKGDFRVGLAYAADGQRRLATAAG